MQSHLEALFPVFFQPWCSRQSVFSVLLGILLAVKGVPAQPPDRITQAIDPSQTQFLPNHHPSWANAANSMGAAPADLALNQLTMVLARSPQQEQAFEQFLADQQNPASPDYHHWLTPAEVGERFGLSDSDISAVTGWLQSQGLRVNWISPSRIFIGFGGAAADVGRAFGTELRYYKVNGAQHISVASDPVIPRALVPAIKAIRGLYTINEHPNHHSEIVEGTSPQLTSPSGGHYIAPADFATIYDLPTGLTGAGVTIGILSWSRTDFADFSHFRSRTGTSFPDPTEVVPTAYGGVDPGPAYTTQQSCTNCTDAQGEATLDVVRAGSVASGANLLLVVSSSAGTNDGIGADAQYLVNTSPVPAQVMTVSFGACESSVGPSGVAFWDTLFQQAAAEGISAFVASGDSGAAGCDTAFTAPPASPGANSPNYICSSGYATCVGGTEFNDANSGSMYWNSTNGPNLSSAVSYIPEGGWNDSTTTSVAASGGGVSAVIATPSWQTGTGVPAARSGRYTPDVSFSAGRHDAYFGCFAAGGGDCVGTNFVALSGTSAAAPSMAGATALLDQKLGGAQGNINPQIYSLAATAPAVFHDATVASSGVANCDINTASMCNNSIPSPSSQSGGQAGFLLGTGYDQVTGLGSVDLAAFLNGFAIPPTIKILASPPSLTFSSEFIGYSATAQLGVQNSGSSSLNPLTLSISGANSGDFSQTSNCQSALGPGSSCQIQVTFKPTAAGTRTAALAVSSSNATNSPQNVSLTGTGSSTLLTPLMTLMGSSITTAQPLIANISVHSPSAEYPTPTGTVKVVSGSYASAPAALSAGSATITVPAGSLPAGSNAVNAMYTPDTASSSLYTTATAATVVVVTAPAPPGFAVSGLAMTVTAGATSNNTLAISVMPANGFTGTVALSAAVTSSPSGAQNLPALSFGSTSQVNVTGATAAAATMTIATVASTQSSCTASNQLQRKTPWYAATSAALACVLLLGIAPRRRRWRSMLGMLVLLIGVVGGMFACGGGSKSTACSNIVTPGTTPGTYTITITGTSGTIVSTGTVSLVVQ